MPENDLKNHMENHYILTCKLQPFYSNELNISNLPTEWLREIINKMVRKIWDKMEAFDADPSLFFNRDIKTNKTRVGYPLIIYHFIDDEFYVTGINEGAKSLETLISFYSKPFKQNGIMFSGMEKSRNNFTETEFVVVENLFNYSLIKWIPFHHSEGEFFNDLSFTQKADFLNQKLFKHLTLEFCKFLHIPSENLKVEITDLTKVYSSPVFYKNYQYRAFDINFKTNINLPEFLTLGNIQAFGFGRVVKGE